MFSKLAYRILNILALLASAVTFTACGEFLNNKKQEAEVIEFKTQKFECLQVLPDQVKAFADGKASDQEIEALFNCSKSALQYFNEKTFGKMQNAYTPQEIRNFFGKFFLKDNNFSKDFSVQVMKLKQILIGGSEQYITKDELADVLSIFDVLKEESLKLSPYLKILLVKNVEKQQWKDISVASAQLSTSLQKILVKTRLTKTDFSYEDLKAIVHSFSDIRNEGIKSADNEKLESNLDDVELIFKLLMGEKSYFQTQKDWNRGISTLTSLLDVVLKIKHLDVQFNFESVNNNYHLYSMAQQLIQVLEQSPMMVKKGFIPVSVIDRILKEVLPKYTDKVSPTAAIKFYKVALMKILDPSRQGDIRSLSGIEVKHLSTLKRELNLWYLHQKLIDSLKYDKNGIVKYSDISKAYKGFKIEDLLPKEVQEDSLEKEAISKAWGDVGLLISANFPVAISGIGQLQIHPFPSQMQSGWYGLTQTNLMRMLSRFLMLGYSKNRVVDTLEKSFISQEGLIQWYSDFSELGLDLKAFDPRSGNSGGKSFLEANFFTFSGDGNDQMNFRETYEFVSILFASGLGSSAKVYDDMLKLKCGLKHKDVMGFEKLDYDCFKRNLKLYATIYFKNMPRMSAYIAGLHENAWSEFFDHVFNASLVSDQKDVEAEIANIRSFVTILHYIESVFSVYDRNADSVLSYAEVSGASGRFLPFFRMVKPGTADGVLHQVYLYLIYKGRIPSAYELGKFQWERAKGLGHVGRMEIARLFGALKGELNK